MPKLTAQPHVADVPNSLTLVQPRKKSRWEKVGQVRRPLILHFIFTAALVMLFYHRFILLQL